MKHLHISARSNPWVQQWLRYQAKPTLRKTAGLVWLEGEHLVHEALNRSGNHRYAIEQLVFQDCATARDAYTQLCQRYDYAHTLDVIWLSNAVMKALCSMDSAPDVCAVLKLHSETSTIDFAAPAVVLDQVQDPGNVGTIIRLCAAFGVPQVLLTEGCASAWSHKVIRAAQGAQLAVHVVEGVDLSAVYASFKANHVPIVATTLAKGSVSLNTLPLAPRMVWVFGSEGQGISPVTQHAATQCVHIPMQGGFESLNVGTAAAICLWQWQSHVQLQSQQQSNSKTAYS